MDTIPRVVSEAYELLRSELYTYLDETEYVAEFYNWTDKEKVLVRQAILDLVTVIRGLVVDHEHNSAGNCKKCGTPWPCEITETIHRLIKDPTQVFSQILEHVRKLDPAILRA